MPILDDILDTILKARDPTTGTVTYTNRRSVAETMEGALVDTGISGRPSVSYASMPAASESMTGQLGKISSMEVSNLMQAFADTARISDPKLREQATAKLQFQIGEFQSRAAAEATAQAQSLLGISKLQEQIANSERLDRASQLWSKYQSDSNQTLLLKDQLLQTQQVADNLASKLFAQNGQLNGVLKASEVFLKGSLSPESAGDKKENSQVRMAAFTREVGKKLGGDEQMLEATPDDMVLANKPLVDAAIRYGGTGNFGTGPYSAANTIQQNSMANNKYINSGTMQWVTQASKEEALIINRDNPGVLKNEKMLSDALDTSLTERAKMEFRGDADNSLLTRLPTVGELKQIPEIAKLNIFRYIANAEPSTRYSMKQLIGFALKDERYKSDGAMRANLVYDIQELALRTFERTRTINMAYSLPVNEQIGYRITPSELIDAANNRVPDSLKRRYFDLTNPGDIQVLLNLALNYRGVFGGNPSLSNLLSMDQLLKGSLATKPAVAEKR